MRSTIFQPVSLAIGLRYAGARGENRFASFVSLFSTIGITLGVMALIIVSSVMNGFEDQLKGRILGVIPHALVTGPEGRLAGDAFPAERVRDWPHVLAAAPFIQSEAMVQSPGQLAALALQGIAPESLPAGDRLRQSLEPEQLARLQPGAFQVILGIGLARRLDVQPGDQVRILASEGSRYTPLGRTPSQRLFTLAGTFAVGADVDDQVALLHLEDARRLLRYPPGTVSGLRLWLDDAFAVDSLRQQPLPDGLMLQDWRRERGELFNAVAMEKRLMSLMLVLIIMVAAFNILSALVMVVVDKQGEVAILRTMGMQRGDIQRIFMVQGLWSGVIGGLTGALLGVLACLYLNPVLQWLGINLYVSAGGTGLPVVLVPGQILGISLGALAISLLATLYPAHRAAHIRPAEALRYE